MTHFEVWDTDSANMIDDTDTQLEALDIVRSLLATGDAYYQTNLALDSIMDDGTRTLFAAGSHLVQLAQAASPVA